MNRREPIPSRVHAPALERSRLAQRLRRVVRGEVSFDVAARCRYASDVPGRGILPVGVVVPVDEADVLATLALAAEMNVPIFPRGAAACQSGPAAEGVLVIDTSRHLNRIVGFDPAAALIEVQPGVTVEGLERFLARQGLRIAAGLPPLPQATIGGVMAAGASGSAALALGSLERALVGIDAVLPDGTQEFFGPFGAGAARPMRSARTGSIVSRLFEIGLRERDVITQTWPRAPGATGGYNLDVFSPVSGRPWTADGSVNLSHLLLASEGTLAHFQRLHLRLAPRPRHAALCAVGFASIRAVLDALPAIIEAAPESVDLFDAVTLDRTRAATALPAAIAPLLAVPAPVTVLIGLCGDEPVALQARAATLSQRLRTLSGFSPRTGTARDDADPRNLPGQLHAAALHAARARSQKDASVGFVDACVLPLERVDDYLAGLEAAAQRKGGRVAWSGHALAGAFSLLAWVEFADAPASPADERVQTVAAMSDELLRRLRGALGAAQMSMPRTSERLSRRFDSRLVRAFAEVKRLFDPQGLMNPGRLLPSHERAADARSAPRAARISDAGLDAVADCTGGGACRVAHTGAMCPSYRVTRSETHSPRGRVNTLRWALSGALGEQGLASPAVRDAMSLCIGCKACKRECPSGIDLARLRIEVRARTGAAPGRRLRAGLFARFPRYAPLLARIGWLPNLWARVPGLRAAGERLLGIPATRTLPHWPGTTFLREQRVQAVRRRSTRPPPGGSHDAALRGVEAADRGDEVVLFADCFNDHTEPENLRAAQRVLEAVGCRVRVAMPSSDDAEARRPLCCGRTFLSQGRIEEARAEARRTVAALAPYVARGVAVVGLEPACLLTMRDEFLTLGLGEQADRLAEHAMTFEEFVVRAAGRLDGRLGPLRWERALVQPHCHQRALGAVSPIADALALIPGLQVELLDAGCCGMGDGFGDEAEHFMLSMKMAEAALLPAVRAADASTVIVADGCGCRRQIADGAQRASLHVARLLDLALRGNGVAMSD